MRVFLLLLLLSPAFFSQCTSDPKVSTDPATRDTAGHQRMIFMLDSIAKYADPATCYHLNSAKAELYRVRLEQLPPAQRPFAQFKYAEQLLNAGRTEAALVNLQQVIDQIGDQLNPDTKIVFEYLALAYLRLGEQANCIDRHNAESCILPLQGGGIYTQTAGPENAIHIYQRILEAFPEDLQSRWLLNIAYMTMGEYPSGVPPQWRIPENIFAAQGDIRFTDIAIPLGIDVKGLSGGVCLEDFDRDGDLDLFVTSYGLLDQVRYFTNEGEDGFVDRTESAGLAGIVSGLNTLHADYDNDGDRDILILRGGWLEGGTHPNSLLRNNGDNSFTDVTIQAGLLSFHPTQAAGWADVDADGWLDLYIANESFPNKTYHPNEFYRNNGDGTFTEMAEQMAIAFTGYYKGAHWGDINNDRLPDLYLSNMAGDNRLLVNRGDNFEDIAPRAALVDPQMSFPCWFFDYNNDGWDDLLVAGYNLDLEQQAAGDLLREYLGTLEDGDWLRLYRNDGNETFSEVAEQAGVRKLTFAMGCNFGDLDNDGWSDFYLGTGKPDFRSLVPNRMFLNRKGRSFTEITMNGFGHIQKGHGVAFGDIDNDGDQDIYEVMGGAFEGDISANVLFANPGHPDHHWVTIELEGVTCNRDAIGSKIAVYTSGPRGNKITWVSVNTGASFGAASLQQEIGLGPASTIDSVEVFWAQPGPERTVYHEVPLDRFLLIKETLDSVQVLERQVIDWRLD